MVGWRLGDKCCVARKHCLTRVRLPPSPVAVHSARACHGGPRSSSSSRSARRGARGPARASVLGGQAAHLHKARVLALWLPGENPRHAAPAAKRLARPSRLGQQPCCCGILCMFACALGGKQLLLFRPGCGESGDWPSVFSRLRPPPRRTYPLLVRPDCRRRKRMPRRLPTCWRQLTCEASTATASHGCTRTLSCWRQR